MARARLASSFTRHARRPKTGIKAAVAVMRPGRLHRSDTLPGEAGETMELERKFALWQRARIAQALVLDTKVQA